MQITRLYYRSLNYPDQLRHIDNAPKELFVLGEMPKGPMVAVVGTRTPSDYGRQVTYKFAYELASAGVIVVSGLALGLDGVAHGAAVDAGGKTIAVLGTAINRIYPGSHRALSNRILDGHGAIVSEYPPDYPGHAGTFSLRNRIIAGLSLATLVTEAKAESGSLITARDAGQQNRTVMAVPGNITSERSAGPNNLIRQAGAVAVSDVSDILTALNLDGISYKPVKAKSKEEAMVIDLINKGHTTTQALIEQSQLTASQFANIISLMEITGKVKNLGAGVWVLGR